MGWTFDQRINRAIIHFLNLGLVADNTAETVKRPPYFNQYHLGIGFSPILSQWSRYNEIKDQLQLLQPELGFHIYSNSPTFNFNVYTNNPAVLKWLFKNRKIFDFGYIRTIHQDWRSRELPAPKPKSKFYHEFNYRIRFKDRHWAEDNFNRETLERLEGNWFTPIHMPYLLYLTKVSDVILIKIMSSSISEIQDRSMIPV
jgi:hypothetical protein